MTAQDTAPLRRRGLIAPHTFEDVFDVPGSIRAMAVLRIVLAPVVVVHLWPFLVDTLDGVSYLDHFNEPWFTFLPQAPAGAQVALIWTGVAGAVAMGLGWHTRLAAPLTTVCVAGNFFLSQRHFRHNRAFLIFLLVAVALSDSGRILSLDARRRRSDGVGPPDDRATLWPLWLLRIMASSVYLASGISKLIDPDWAGGLVLWDRAVRHQHLVATRVPEPIAGWVVDLVTQRWVHAVTSPLAVAMEVCIGVGLWFGRTRIAAVWVAVLFHLSIELSASVEVFSLAAVAALAIWATPSTRDRRVVVSDDAMAGRIRRLDWLARFDVRVDPGAAAEPHGVEVHDRDGSTLHGREALQMVRSRLPLTFFIVAPRNRWR
ncbi:MAG: HTTM domain-containing protein [Acidimicrobiales bacterium]|nr:HTTM domain-containing protein [Acidimicrobiales bacterium]